VHEHGFRKAQKNQHGSQGREQHQKAHWILRDATILDDEQVSTCDDREPLNRNQISFSVGADCNSEIKISEAHASG